MKKINWIFAVIIFIATASASVVGWLYFSNFGSIVNDKDKWGQFGDYVGGTLNPVFGFLSLIVLLLVYKQNKEELRDTKEVLAEQSETLKIQRFEQTFFSFLELYNKTANEFVYSSGKGKFTLEKLVNDATSLHHNRHTIARHSKIIIRTIEFLDHANINNKLLYSGLLRDSLINEELILLCREIINVPEYEKIFKLLYKYGIFENFDFDDPNNFVAPHFKKLKQELDTSNKALPDDL